MPKKRGDNPQAYPKRLNHHNKQYMYSVTSAPEKKINPFAL